VNKIFCIALTFAFSYANAQTHPGLSAPASVYRTIENMSIKREVGPARNPSDITLGTNAKIELLAKEHLQSRGTVALALIDNGNIVYEGYANGANEDHRLISFSMAKSLTALTIGEAYCSGKINSLDDVAEKYAPELKNIPVGKVSIRNLLRMSSGVRTPYKHHGTPYFRASDDILYLRASMLDIMSKYSNTDNSSFLGTPWHYSNMDTDALYFVIKGATGTTFSDCYQSTVGEKAGLKNISYWSLDKDKNEITHAFYYATLQDWIRISLYIRDQLKNKSGTCVSNFIKDATTTQAHANTPEFSNYGYQFYVKNKSTFDNDFWMVGFAGQRIGFNMKNDKIILNFSWTSEPEKVYRLFKEFANK
jgi:CubicO group peptidase (beta-lactamase class C family)